MTTQPSIESLRAEAKLLRYDESRAKLCQGDFSWFCERQDAALTELAAYREREPELIARAEKAEAALAALCREWGGHPVEWSPDEYATRICAEVDALRAERDALKNEATAYDMTMDNLTRELTAANARADEAEKNYRFMVERAADEKLDGYRELGKRAAEAENRAAALAARVEVLRETLVLVAEGEPGTIQREPCRHCGGGHGEDEDGCEICLAHEHGCPVLLALSSTPAASLEAHDARVRQEALEEAWERVRVNEERGHGITGIQDVQSFGVSLKSLILTPDPQPSTENTAPRTGEQEETK